MIAPDIKKPSAKLGAVKKPAKPRIKKPFKRKGFLQAGSLLEVGLRQSMAKRGFGESRVLTHWAEIVGADIARIAEPLKLNYPKDGFGADLVVLCVGANAPLVQMRIPDIIERVNSCYGYRAITRVKVTQTRGKHAGVSVAHSAMSQSNLPPPTGLVPSGFAEEATPFQHRTKADILRVSKKQDMHRALANVQNPALKTALESLGESIFSVRD
ncbi:MAG: DUF721 domain-containing protein [Proteobacteria bacterium]|nr:DUF721 domain-containing protein [Pseudomonadota bacterium]